ncbi:MAG: XRE family transcriptional regulator [Zunongwangia sp.]|uniref:Lambda repressor-like DNA-binding protein n=2 Tax=Zunongwangia profunda TaxID=398743 RepID=D5BFZ6_ZUNPS|nr:lambda repressor-like DNA-binding protein [Zunongwangia profunda SM-A87]MAO38058.1 XRE family transcriptional regulator [Zunongwangia sp.]MAS70776.1 XRE family transcriptional regulator [Zunongwangia sp.]HCV82256.1 XRE family transcriptional regulator [Zunongwangia profunda]|tara:strand:+ start:897 stop:1331 length:435 start_codon:yes stop_codon:yes gene_type:complete
MFIFEIMSTATKTSHIGRKISRIRELRGMKQEALAAELGISQQSVSSLEQSEHIEDEKLEKVAKVLGVSKEAIENFSEEAIFNNIQNNYEGSTINAGPTVHHQCTFNPLDRLVQAYEEKEKLYERLLKAEKEKVAYLEKLLDKK